MTDPLRVSLSELIDAVKLISQYADRVQMYGPADHLRSAVEAAERHADELAALLAPSSPAAETPQENA